METAGNPPVRLRQGGIASLSKVLCIVNPDLYAIYDARVAAALNAVQLKAQLDCGMAFRYVTGRNVTIHGRRDDNGRLLTKGFVHQYPYKKLRHCGWTSPKHGQNYWDYLGLLHACRQRIKGYRLSELEMALFYAAPVICAELLKCN